MTWRAFFPESIRFGERWLCDATIYNGVEKFPLTVTYERSIDEVWPQIRAAIALRDATTKKPPSMIPAGTDIDVPDPAVAVVVPPTKEEQARVDYFRDRADWLTQRELAEQPPELAARWLPEYGSLG